MPAQVDVFIAMNQPSVDKYIGKVVEQGVEYKKVEDVCLNIISILNKLCPDITFAVDAIKLHAINPFP